MRVRRPAFPLALAGASRALLAGPIVVLVLTFASGARADEKTDIEKSYSLYVGHKYEEAEARLRALLDAKTGGLKDPDSIADARMYLGAVLVAESKKDDAAAVFEALLIDKLDYEPDPLRVSTAAVDAFLDVRAHLRTRLASIKADLARKEQEERAKAEAERQKAAAHLAMLERLASEEVIRHTNSRWIALLPFGVGQFQNGQVALGGALLATEAALALGSGIGAGVAQYEAAQASDAFKQQLDAIAHQYNSYAQQAAWTGNLLAAGFGLVALVGIVQAELAFVPEREIEVRRRPLPLQSLAPVAPVLSPTGVGFRF